MSPFKLSVLALLAGAAMTPSIAQAVTLIADPPPTFRIYDVDRREREMRRLLGEMDGTPALSHAAARRALGQLDEIHRQEEALRARNGGRLTVSTIRIVDARLNALSRRLGLREPAY